VLRSEVRPLGVEIVTVCLETLGADEARPYVEAAAPEHPTLIDVAHRVDELFGIVNIPNAVWIDEDGHIVRPAEPAWPAPRDVGGRRAALGDGLPERMAQIMNEASRIVAWTADGYADAVRDWARHGSASRFVLPPQEVIARSGGRDRHSSAAAAQFALAQHLERTGRHDRAVGHFREAHRLAPDNWTYKRQAWSLEGGPEGPLRRFWQGPVEGEEWPYDSDWLSDIRSMGAEGYYRETEL
jgi:hypothetical protein